MRFYIDWKLENIPCTQTTVLSLLTISFHYSITLQKLRKRAIELNNGRAAMMGILALMVHEELNGEPYVINALCGQPSNFNAGL